jgi:uncharacterized cupin superfamily protein
MAAVMFALASAIGLPTLPDLFADPVLFLIPGPLFGRLIDALQFSAKSLLLAALLEGQLLVCALVGRLWASRAVGPGASTAGLWRSALKLTLAIYLGFVTVGLALLNVGLLGAALPTGPLVGLAGLGCALHIVPPGKRAFPFHSHRVQEEMFFVIEGTGEVRLGSESFPIRAGDIIACPTGGPETAHQIINTGNRELKYLAVSSRDSAEICEYPDSGKIAGFAENMRFVFRGDQQVGYWEGE